MTLGDLGSMGHSSKVGGFQGGSLGPGAQSRGSRQCGREGGRDPQRSWGFQAGSPGPGARAGAAGSAGREGEAGPGTTLVGLRSPS